ncbi:hypothetical protein [Vibrio azureus]|nr:hypothetical protein [Vibrio azureus]
MSIKIRALRKDRNVEKDSSIKNKIDKKTPLNDEWRRIISAETD